jgi:hypothetical protein
MEKASGRRGREPVWFGLKWSGTSRRAHYQHGIALGGRRRRRRAAEMTAVLKRRLVEKAGL